MESMDLSALFDGVYAGRRVLVTGHTGFKGSWLVSWLRTLGAEVAGLSLNPDTTPSHWAILDLKDIADHRIDLRDSIAVRDVICLYRPEIIFHLAAQPLVRRSYREPIATFDVNVMGLINLLEAVRACPSVRVVINATTDKVYEECEVSAGYLESHPLGGHDPYSSSKACAEIVSACYRKSFFNSDDGRGFRVRLATARAGNVIGGGDWAEDRLVPDLIRAATTGLPIRIRNPGSIRPWQHVLEPLSGYLMLGRALLESDHYIGAWNFGPGPEGELSVRSLLSQFSGNWRRLETQLDNDYRQHEANALRLNCEKSARELSWRSVWDIQTTALRTSEWYQIYYETGKARTTDDLAAYVENAKSKGLRWAA